MPPLGDLFTNITIFTILLGVFISLCSITFTIIITVLAIRFARSIIGKNKTVMQQGIPATAKILEVEQTGVLVNHMPQVRFRLEVQHPQRGTYEASAKAVIQMVHIPQYQPGAEISVKVHPTDPTQVEIVRTNN